MGAKCDVNQTLAMISSCAVSGYRRQTANDRASRQPRDARFHFGTRGPGVPYLRATGFARESYATVFNAFFSERSPGARRRSHQSRRDRPLAIEARIGAWPAAVTCFGAVAGRPANGAHRVAPGPERPARATSARPGHGDKFDFF